MRYRFCLIASGIALNLASGLFCRVPIAAQALPAIVATPGAGNIGTIVTDNSTFNITGGTQRQTVLFHSFETFSPASRDVIFQLDSDQSNVDTVIGRITGSDLSLIDSDLSISGGDRPDLFLLNPNGFRFGPDASLSLPGSFTATTASSLYFGEGSVFNTTDAGDAPLLSINVPTGLQFGASTGAIAVEGAELRVNSGETLRLLGGPVEIVDSDLRASGGRVDVAALGQGAEIELSQTGLSVRGDRNPITLRDRSRIRVLGDSGGSIYLWGSDVALQERSQLRAGIDLEGTVADTGGADITGTIAIDATGEASFSGRSFVDNEIDSNATRKGGGVEVTAQSLFVTGGSRIQTDTLSNATSGDVTITVSDEITVSSLPDNGRSSRIQTLPADDADGKGGNIVIQTRDLTLVDGGRLSVEARGQGNAGDISIVANGDILIAGVSPDGLISRIDAESDDDATGNGGNVTIETQNLTVAQGGRISLETESPGDAGDLTIRASGDIRVEGAPDGIFSRVTTEADRRSSGQAGDMLIEAANLIVRGGGRLSVETEASGDAGTMVIRTAKIVEIVGFDPVSKRVSRLEAEVEESSSGKGGDIFIDTGKLLVDKGGLISVEAKGLGNAGDINIRAREAVVVRGFGPTVVSRIAAEADDTGRGDGGDILIETQRLQILEGGRVAVETESSGNAGTLTIRASESVEIIGIGQSRSSEVSSSLEARVDERGTGSGGNILLETDVLRLADGGAIAVDALGNGPGGSATIRANRVELSGSGADGKIPTQITAASQSNSPAGSLRIESKELTVSDGSLIEVSNVGEGGAGDLEIQTQQIRLDNGSLLGFVTAGDRGNISLTATDSILLRNNSLIATTASQTANGGNIRINAPLLIGLNNSDITANAVEGEGGNILIKTQSLLGLEFREMLTPKSDITASSEFGLDGNVEIRGLAVNSGLALSALPSKPISDETLIAAACDSSEENRFVASGNGGLPRNPRQPLTSAILWKDSRYPSDPKEVRVNHHSHQSRSKGGIHRRSSTLVEASHWYSSEQGHVALLPPSISAQSSTKPENCLS